MSILPIQFVASGTLASVSSNSITVTIPSSRQVNDLLILHLALEDSNSTFSTPAGWTSLSNDRLGSTGGPRQQIFYKYSDGTEANVTSTVSISQRIKGIVSVFRNVKSILSSSWSWQIAAYSISPGAMTAPEINTVAVIFNYGDYSFTPPTNFTERYDQTLSCLEMAHRSMNNLTSLTAAETTFTYGSGTAGAAVSRGVFLIPFSNNPPSLTLTSPSNNQTLVEGNTYVIAGTATEADAGNVVTVKYKIDNGSTYNITAAVSDGTTPINFSKTLTYLNNRLYDGQNPVTPILDDNVTHKLTVWAEDLKVAVMLKSV